MLSDRMTIDGAVSGIGPGTTSGPIPGSENFGVEPFVGPGASGLAAHAESSSAAREYFVLQR